MHHYRTMGGIKRMDQECTPKGNYILMQYRSLLCHVLDKQVDARIHSRPFCIDPGAFRFGAVQTQVVISIYFCQFIKALIPLCHNPRQQLAFST